MIQKIKCVSIALPWQFYQEYLIDKLGVKLVNYIEKKFENTNREERYIEGYSITYPSEKSCYYNELFLLDVGFDDNKLLPISIIGINTSSLYALEKCYIDSDDEGDIQEKTKEEIIGMITNKIKDTNSIYELVQKIFI